MTNATCHHVFRDERLAFMSEGPTGSGRCGLFWLGGFKSQMTGEKANWLAEWAQAQGRNLLRFDYSGHGLSSGAFTDGTISRWLEQSAEMFQRHAPGPRIVLGSSMGGWLALLMARHLAATHPEEAARIRGFVLLAPAVDMTATLIPQGLTGEERRQLEADGVAERPSAYGDGPYRITRQLLEDGEKHLLFGRPYEVDVPVAILHGDKDPDVPWQHGHRVFEMIASPDARFTLIKGGDHRLSDARALALLEDSVASLCARVDSSG